VSIQYSVLQIQILFHIFMMMVFHKKNIIFKKRVQFSSVSSIHIVNLMDLYVYNTSHHINESSKFFFFFIIFFATDDDAYMTPPLTCIIKRFLIFLFYFFLSIAYIVCIEKYERYVNDAAMCIF
jgi:hypothetical protein